jgi:hypothetical protein|tara:strand:- start:33 stop:1121 length:1089 start_codon:yes stop_codon:yes gene_type:complete
MKSIALVLLVAVVVLEGCGGGGGGDAPFTPRTVVDIPPVVVEPTPKPEPPVVVPEPAPEPPVVVVPELTQMSKPSVCLTVASSTGLPDYSYITCDGVPTSGDVSYPYDADNTEPALIKVLAVVDTKTPLKGLTVEEWVDVQFDFANDIYSSSGVHIILQVAGIVEVDVAEGDLLRQYNYFTGGRGEFVGLDEKQDMYEADFAFLFKGRAVEPWACGVASLTADRSPYEKRRGVSQCHVGEEFNETSTTRYYERASITFIHEMGHLFGMEHNIESATMTPLFPFSYGYLLPEYEDDKTDEWNGYGSVMSYSDKPTHVMSDPAATFLIPELGIEVMVGSEEADAVAHLNRVRYYMSQLHEENVQ